MEKTTLNDKEARNIARFLDSISEEYMYTLSSEMRWTCLAILTEKPELPFDAVRSEAIRELKPDPLVFEA